METQPSPGVSSFTNRRQKNLQKYRQHIQRKKTSAEDGSEIVEQPTTQNTTTEKTLSEEGIANDTSKIKVKPPPTSPLVGKSKKVAPIIDVPPSPVSASKGTPSRVEVLSPVSPLFKRRPSMVKKLSKKKGVNASVSDNSSAKCTDHPDEAIVMADSTNSSQETPLSTADAVPCKKGEPTSDTTNNNGEAEENEENKSAITDFQAHEEQDEDKSCIDLASNSYDLRSIHDFPTEPIQNTSDAIECSQDPSWDTAKVFFNEFKGPTAPEGDTMDMFDTSESTSWPPVDTASFSRDFETNNDGFLSVNSMSNDDEEKKEKDLADVNEPSQVPPPSPDSPNSDMSPRRLRSRNGIVNPLDNPPINPLFGTGFPDDIKTDEAEEKEHDDTLEEEPARDDEDLLGMKSNEDDDICKNETQLSKEKRLQQYSSSPKDGDDSSACSSDAEQEDEESSENSESGEVEYISQLDEKDTEMVEAYVEHKREELTDIIQDVPAFSLSAAAAAAAEGAGVNAADVSGTSSFTFNGFEERNVHKQTCEDPGTVADFDQTNTLSMSQDATATEDSSEQSPDFKSTCRNSSETEKKEESYDDIEDSASLVGVSLVPSFASTNGPAARANKDHTGVQTQGLMPSLNLPPPPPPPLTAKKKRKKKKNNSANDKIPRIAPPPEEKLLKWQQTKGRPLGHLAAVSEEKGTAPGEDEPRFVGGASQVDGEAEQLTCGDFADPFALGDLTLSLTKDCQGSSVQPILSPVDAARSAALDNAMKRANCGATAPSPSGLSGYTHCGTVSATKSLFEDDLGSPASIESSFSADGPSLGNQYQTSGNSEKVINGQPKCAATRPADYLQKLISTSDSHSPSSWTAGKTLPSSSTTTAPIFHNQKMAERVALASYAAAMKFEENYSHTPNTDSVENEDGTAGFSKQFPSLFCGNDDLQANLEKIATSEEPAKELPSLLCGPDVQKKFESELAGLVGSNFSRRSKTSDHEKPGGLVGGAFAPWSNAVYAEETDRKISCSTTTSSASMCRTSDDINPKAACSSEGATDLSEAVKLHNWLIQEVLQRNDGSSPEDSSDDVLNAELAKLLEKDEILNKLCEFVCEKANEKIDLQNKDRAERNGQLSPRKKMRPFSLGTLSARKSTSVIAANFVSFLHRLSKMSGIPSPYGDDNPYLMDLISTSIHGTPSPQNSSGRSKMQMLVFERCPAHSIVNFFFQVCKGEEASVEAFSKLQDSDKASVDMIEACRAASPSPMKKKRANFFAAEKTTPVPSPKGNKKWTVPDTHPSPFEVAVKADPTILTAILGCLGDPVAVCRIKMLNRNCNTYIAKNEQILMRDAVRLGGMSMNVRPSFWLWVTLEKFGSKSVPNNDDGTFRRPEDVAEGAASSFDLAGLERAGREGKWHHVIERDVSRAFGNMPPHKTGARLRSDSIVRALVTWGRNRIMKRGVRGDGNPPASHSQESIESESEAEGNQAPMDTVSDWGGVSPVASFAGSNGGTVSNSGRVPDSEEKRLRKHDSQNKGSKSSESQESHDSQSVATDLLVLSGNALTDEMKSELQSKLGFILHTLAASHKKVGYCQGMDYVVAHLLRILQDTVRWRAAHGTLPSSIKSAPKAIDLKGFDAEFLSQNVEEVDSTLVVEETVFRVMDTLFTTYNLQHMYWPELRCLKTCCRVFERIIQIKLPVLADHFEHHELNVGLFALGWFQTLFLYLPSMPSATVCHMWDIWLVERSFKIFFRVATAILFLSQPILLNHELEGMMTYLNTFPDATLLNPDILIACALQIKITNKMLMEIETQVAG